MLRLVLYGAQQLLGIRYSLPVTGDSTQRRNRRIASTAWPERSARMPTSTCSPTRATAGTARLMMHPTISRSPNGSWNGVNKWFRVRGTYFYA
jgi:hypothetical protein